MATAVKILSEKRVLPDGYIMDITVWGVLTPVPPCAHPFKYSLFFGRPGERLIAYDNERGKGDHKHIQGVEHPYVFVSLRQLVADFADDVRMHCGMEIAL
ncbi:MAG TPA: DUF6516 family protein [Azospirillum sp.]|nr:DUF6516 family protein [Azospirillum sp.]